MSDALVTYLRDHLAGSVAAVELLDRLAAAHEGTPFGRFVAMLHAEVAEDQGTLESLLHELGAGESRVRHAAAWLSEKAARLKLRVVGTDERLGRLEALETLALGILGKRGLWRALGAAVKTPGAPAPLRRLDLVRLESRAQAQYDRVEVERLAAARAALGAPA
jgi:hypothetical protein